MSRSILFVCLGNICRSPAAEAIFKKLLEKSPLKGEVLVESCGIGEWHIGSPPHERVRQAALSRGFVLSGRARQLQREDLEKFELILAADRAVLEELYKLADHADLKRKISLLTEFSPAYRSADVPDPYFGSDALLEESLDIIEDACRGLLDHLS